MIEHIIERERERNSVCRLHFTVVNVAVLISDRFLETFASPVDVSRSNLAIVVGVLFQTHFVRFSLM